MAFFDGAGGRVHYRTWPVAEPRAVLVFLHGRGQQSADYHRFGRALRGRGIETWAIDHAGHGLSEGDPARRPPIPDLAADAARLFGVARAARPAVPAVLMGHSLGAAVAATACAGLELSGLILCGTPKYVADAEMPTGVPILVVHGVDDRMTPIDPVRAWAAARPGVDLREFADAGHDLLHEPIRDVVTAAAADFVLAASG